MGYSNDLRVRVIQVVEGGAAARAAARQFVIGDATAIRWAKRWRETGSFVAGNEKLLSLIIWPHFWAIQIILLVLIAMYCMMHELVRVVGKDKVMRIFFGPTPAPEV